MGRPPTTQARVKEFHAQAVAAFGVGAKLDRASWDKAMMETYGLSYDGAAGMTRSGEILGLWRRYRSLGDARLGAGWVELMAPAPTPSEPWRESPGGQQAEPSVPLPM